MAIEVRCAGFDFGQCLMDATGLRNHLVIGDVCKEIGEPHLIDLRSYKYRVLKEKYESYSILKEGHRDQILDYIFDNSAEPIDIFSQKEQEYISPGRGAEDALQYLQSQGVERAIVAELKKTLGPIGTDMVTRFLANNRLFKYFEELYTPLGRIDLRGNSVDPRYRGKTKEEGTFYDALATDLHKRGIKTNDCVMIGDKPWTDIIPAKARGFKTIQYTGYTDYGRFAEADFVISDFRELKTILRRPNEKQ